MSFRVAVFRERSRPSACDALLRLRGDPPTLISARAQP